MTTTSAGRVFAGIVEGLFTGPISPARPTRDWPALLPHHPHLAGATLLERDWDEHGVEVWRAALADGVAVDFCPGAADEGQGHLWFASLHAPLAAGNEALEDAEGSGSTPEEALRDLDRILAERTGAIVNARWAMRGAR